MFGLASFSKRQPDAWRLQLTFSDNQELQVTWTANEGESTVLAAVHDVLSDASLAHEFVRARLLLGQQLFGAFAAFEQAPVRLIVSIHAYRSQLTAIELVRSGGSSTLSTSVGLALWGALDVTAVTRLHVADGGAIAALSDLRVLSRFQRLCVANLNGAGLAALPGTVGLLTGLQELRLVGNQLRILPPEIGQLTNLRVLAADSNQLTILPGELRQCTLLQELTLQHNRLTSVLLNFAALQNLKVLHLYDNPLEFLPEISPCTQLEHLTVANLRVTSDAGYTSFKVEVLPPPPGSGGSGIAIPLWDTKQSDKLRPIFSLMLRRSSGHHPLLAGALRSLAEEDPKNRELMAKQENGLQQLVLMALSDNPVVVKETCSTLTLLAEHSFALADAVVENDADAIMRLLPTGDVDRQLSTLRLLAALAHSSPAAAAKIATDSLIDSLVELIPPRSLLAETVPASSSDEVRTEALKALGNLAFCTENKQKLEVNAVLLRQLSQLAMSRGEPVKVQAAALRVLAILGENELVRRAVGKQPIQDRGLRILSLDGGGMKGMATVRLLRELERHTGRRIHEMFDLIVGTSTGGLLAVALGLRHFDMDKCTYIYKVLGQKVFSRIVVTKDAKEESWMETFYRTLHHKTSHVRAVVVGYKHDASVYEALLREYCDFSKDERCIGDAMIDTAVLPVPHIALVSTLASVSPAPPFVFRNYQLPPGSEERASQMSAHAGSCKHRVWQAVRASSAASFYLEDFSCGPDKFQDGAVTANNPAVVAVQEARLLWPDLPIDVVVSVGVGLAPPSKREKGLTTFVETGAILIESSTSVSRVEEAMATLLPLVPGMQYFRFCAIDPRCAMELDETNPERWAALDAATDDYIALPETQQKFAQAAAALGLANQVVSPTFPEVIVAPAHAKLGSRRNLIALRAPRLGRQFASSDDAVAASLSHLPGCKIALNLQRLNVPPLAVQDVQQQQQQQPSSLAPLLASYSPHNAGSAVASRQEQHQGRYNDADMHTEQEGRNDSTGDAGSLSAYLSSWFGSPAKQPQQAAPAASAGAEPPVVLHHAGQQMQHELATSRCSPASTPGRSVQASGMQTRPLALQTRAPGTGNDVASIADPAGKSLAEAMQESLSGSLTNVGVVHWGLDWVDNGLVLRWKDRLHVVTEPSDDASALLQGLGFSPHSTTLASVFAQQPTAGLPDGRTITLVSSQTQWMDSGPLTVLLLSATSPDVVLREGDLGALAWLLRGQLAVATAALPPSFAAALCRAGARAVVCRSPDSSLNGSWAHPGSRPAPHKADHCCEYFAAFYGELLAGHSVAAALQAAEELVPALHGVFHFMQAEA